MNAKIPLPTRPPSLPPPLIPICTAIFLSGYSQVTVWAQRWHIDYSHAGDTTDSSTDGSQLASRNTVSQCSTKLAIQLIGRPTYVGQPISGDHTIYAQPCPGSSTHQSNRLMLHRSIRRQNKQISTCLLSRYRSTLKLKNTFDGCQLEH